MRSRSKVKSCQDHSNDQGSEPDLAISPPVAPESRANPIQTKDYDGLQPACTPQIDVLRKQRKLTQQELAIKVGVTVTTISKWENGESGTEAIRRFAQLCDVLNCHIEDVVDVTAQEVLIPRIAELRKKAGLSQRELAQQIDATEITIANWERGRSGLDWIERLIRLCDALDCSITELLVYNTQNVQTKRPPLSEIIRRRRADL